MIQHVEQPILEIHDLTVSYDKKPVLWGIDLTLPAGQLIGIIGPNGAGKSSLVKACMGLNKEHTGYIQIMGNDIHSVRKKVAYIPQKESVDWDFPIAVKDVVMMGRYPQIGLFKKPTQADKEAVDFYLRKVQMENFKNRQIAELSGGQQQRVFLARALAQEAEIFFMDEPFAGIDIATEKAIIALLKEMKKNGKTIVVVHHDLQSAVEYFDWAILLNMRLIASAPIEKAFTPELLQETYGGKLTVLAQIGSLIQQQRFERDTTK